MISTYEYDVFGKAHLTSGIDTGNTRLFTGREYDSETGLYYYRARTYDPILGRFIQRDPIGVKDDVNLYGYVGNNPVMFGDPMGLEKALIKSNVLGGIIWEMIGFDTAYSPGEENVNSEVVKEDYGKYGDSVILGAGFFGFGKAKAGREVENIAETVTKKYGNFKCIECAKELGKAFDKAGIEFEKIVIKGGYRDRIFSEKFRDFVSTNGYHEAIKVGDTVFDNIHKTGVKYEKWLDDFGVGLQDGPKLR